jgi:hypothetical protein
MLGILGGRGYDSRGTSNHQALTFEVQPGWSQDA